MNKNISESVRDTLNKERNIEINLANGMAAELQILDRDRDAQVAREADAHIKSQKSASDLFSNSDSKCIRPLEKNTKSNVETQEQVFNLPDSCCDTSHKTGKTDINAEKKNMRGKSENKSDGSMERKDNESQRWKTEEGVRFEK